MPATAPPPEHAPALRVFADHAPRIARVLRLRPSLATTLFFAPARVVHAVGAFLYLAPEAEAVDDDALAVRLNLADPRDLLRAAIPAAPPRLFRALDSAGGLALDVCVRATVLDALRKDFEVRLIRDGTRPVEPAAGARALAEMEAAGARIV